MVIFNSNISIQKEYFRKCIKKEKERKNKSRKISLSEDPAVRLDCCNFDVQSDQSDCYSLDLLRVRESTQITKFNGLIKLRLM